MVPNKNGSTRLLRVLVAFLLVVSLGELYALMLQYQNNPNFQKYVEENPLEVYFRVGGLLLLAVGVSILTYFASAASSRSKLGRLVRRAASLYPVLIGLMALVLWYVLITPFVGDSTFSLQIYLVSLLLLISGSMMARERVTVRMAVRNFTRRKTSMAIVIAGLMIGTAMISGSLVTGDTLTELFTRGAYFGYGYADEVVYARDPLTLGYRYFNLTTYRDFTAGLMASYEAGPLVVGVTPEIIEIVSLNNTNNGVLQAPAVLIGTFPNASIALGDFHREDGSIILSDLSDQEAIINNRLAQNLNATIGNTVSVISASTRLSFRIVGIAASGARSNFLQGDNIFVSLNVAQQVAGRPGQANFIAITNVGGLRGSIVHSQTVGFAANQTLNNLLQPLSDRGCKTDSSTVISYPTIQCAYSEKKASVDSSTESARMLSNFFVVLSTFAILAGIVLIINIFVMLAEERKSEMGMARAVGMKRSQLTKLFLFEGTLYAATASFVGVFAGIGIAWVILYVFGTIIVTFFPVNLSQVLDSFTFTPESLFTAFTEGLFITYFTILFTSWRVSKLNIIRAIRNIAEPPRGVGAYTKLLVTGIIMIMAGAYLFQDSFTSRSAVETLVGPSLIIFGTGLVIARLLVDRLAFTITGIALLIQWGVPALSWNNPIIRNYEFGPELFFAGGIIMVLGGVLVVMYNTDVAVRVLKFFTRGRKTLAPIFRTALAYPENKRFRTAATVAMFALVLFTVSAIAAIAAEQNAALDNIVREQSGGYDILTTTFPVSNLTNMIESNPALSGKTSSVISFNTTILSVARDVSNGEIFGTPLLLGADPTARPANNFFLTNTFSLLNVSANFPTEEDVWNAVRSNSSNVVWSVGFVNQQGPPGPLIAPNVGNVLELTSTTTSKRVTVVGVLNGVFLNGIIGSSELLRDTFGVETGVLAFVKAAPGVNPVDVSNLLKREFAELGLSTIVIPVLVGDFVRIGNSFLALFEGFLALGLVVGIAGLGIISIRSVVERRQEIGILRALGFRRRMVIAAFLVENSYIALLGIFIGVSLGVNLAYAIAISPNSGLEFVMPWEAILQIVGFSYGLALLTTFSSARRAGRIPPAEALRYSE